MLTITIDEKKLTAKEGENILEVARREGIDIPTLCYHESLFPYGACRLCQVEIVYGQQSRLVASCTQPVEEGMIIVTNSERIFNARRVLLELLLARCPDSTKIRNLAEQAGVSTTRFNQQKKDCILCGLCVRLCNERIGANAIGFSNRGPSREVGTPFGRDSRACFDCRACAGICPVDCIRYQETDRRKIIWETQLDQNQKPGRYPKATVIRNLCSGTGCNACVSVCPVGCISLEYYSENDHANKVAVVDQHKCISCRYCERICIKRAIVLTEGEEERQAMVSNVG